MVVISSQFKFVNFINLMLMFALVFHVIYCIVSSSRVQNWFLGWPKVGHPQGLRAHHFSIWQPHIKQEWAEINGRDIEVGSIPSSEVPHWGNKRPRLSTRLKSLQRVLQREHAEFKCHRGSGLQKDLLDLCHAERILWISVGGLGAFILAACLLHFIYLHAVVWYKVQFCIYYAKSP